MRPVDPEILLALHPWRMRRVRFSDMARFLCGPRFLLLFTIAIFFFATFDPKEKVGEIGLPANLAVWSSAAAVYIAAMMGQAWLVGVLFGRRVMALVPVLAMVAALAATWVLWAGYALVQDLPLPGGWQVLRDMPVNYVWAMLFETLGHVYVLPHDTLFREADEGAQADDTPEVDAAQASAAPPAATGDDLMLIGGREVLRSEIRSIRADGHFLQVAAGGETFSTRARLRDVAAQISGARGFQPHRSWWVAVDAITCMEVDGPVVRLCLEHGDKVNVARSRMDAFREIEPEIHAALRARKRKAGELRRMRMPGLSGARRCATKALPSRRGRPG